MGTSITTNTLGILYKLKSILFIEILLVSYCLWWPCVKIYLLGKKKLFARVEQRLPITILKNAFRKWLTRVLLCKVSLLTINLYVKFDLTRFFHFPGLFLGKGPMFAKRKLSIFIFCHLPKHKIDKKAAKAYF